MNDKEEMDEFLFLTESDCNIIGAEINDAELKNGKKTVGLCLTIGLSEKQIEESLKNMKEGDQIPSFQEFEILLTKEQLKKIMKMIREYQSFM